MHKLSNISLFVVSISCFLSCSNANGQNTSCKNEAPVLSKKIFASQSQEKLKAILETLESTYNQLKIEKQKYSKDNNINDLESKIDHMGTQIEHIQTQISITQKNLQYIGAEEDNILEEQIDLSKQLKEAEEKKKKEFTNQIISGFG